MPEYRKDPLTRRCVIVAPDRSKRPNSFVRGGRGVVDSECQFCAGFERETPEAIVEYPQATSSSASSPWQVRVVPNKYAAFVESAPMTDSDESLCNVYPAVGIHEVIVESPNHAVSLTDLTNEQAFFTFMAYRDRLAAVRRDPRIRFGLPFKNVGSQAGASVQHAHSQLIAMYEIPLQVQDEVEQAAVLRQQLGRCYTCDTIDRELADRSRIIAQNARFIALCPYVSRFPFETRIYPRHHASTFESQGDEELRELSQFMTEIVGCIEALLDYPAYNYLIRTSPFDTFAEEHYHWNIELFPRLTNPAGFEWATGYFINPTAPEEAAQRLREVQSARRTCGEDIPIRKTR